VAEKGFAIQHKFLLLMHSQIQFCHARMSLSDIHDFNKLKPGFPLGIAAGMTFVEGIIIQQAPSPSRGAGGGNFWGNAIF
jgi:hypothetical protein